VKQRASRLSRTEMAMIALAALYIIMPIDIVPELVAGPLGLTDDVAAVALIGTLIMQARTRGRAPQPGPQPDPATVQGGSAEGSS